MASRQQIDRLSQRIEALAVRQATDRFAVILVKSGEDEEAAKERHYLARPEDREASETMIVQFVDPKARRLPEEAQ
jgi:hypothetical protein